MRNFLLIIICYSFISCKAVSYKVNKDKSKNIYICSKCKNNVNDICDVPDEFAKFVETDQEFLGWINSIKFPVLDKTNILFKITVCKHGKVLTIKPDTVYTNVDSIVLIKLKEITKWKPAVKDNKKVKSVFNLHFYLKPQ